MSWSIVRFIKKDVLISRIYFDIYPKKCPDNGPQYLWSNPKQTQQIPQALKRNRALEMNQEIFKAVESRQRENLQRAV